MRQLNAPNFWLCVLVAAMTFLPATSNGQQLDVLIEIDLSVVNQITVNSTTGVSNATITGSNITGFYLANFFNDNSSVFETLVAGDLTTTFNPSDFSPNLFRGGADDPGFNIWSISVDTDISFESGVQAFTGTGIWTVDATLYAALLNANPTGEIYFPADTEDDLAGATLIGAYEILGGSSCAFDLGDVNQDGSVNLLDVAPFIAAVTGTAYICEADINEDGTNDLLDVAPFVDLLTGN